MKKESKKRDRWSKTEEEVLVAAWKENYDVIRTSRSREGWQNVLEAVNTYENGVQRTKTQCKDKIRNLSSTYWADRKKHNTTGEDAHFSRHYEEFDAVHGCRDVSTLPEYKEVGLSTKARAMNTEEENEDDSDVEERDEEGTNEQESNNMKTVVCDPCESESSKFLSAVKEEKKKLPKSADKGKKRKKVDIQHEMLELQKEQLEYLRKSDERNQKFVADLEKQKQGFLLDLEKRQREEDAIEKDKDRDFFLKLGKMFSN